MNDLFRLVTGIRCRPTVAAALSTASLSSTTLLPRRIQSLTPRPVATASSLAVAYASPTSMMINVTPPPSPRAPGAPAALIPFQASAGPPHKCCGIFVSVDQREKAFELFIDQMFSHSDMEQGCIGMFLLFVPPTFLHASLQTSHKFGPIASHGKVFRVCFRASKGFTWTEELVMRAACWERWPKCLPPWAIASWLVVSLSMTN